jgi:hypothetical protein
LRKNRRSGATDDQRKDIRKKLLSYVKALSKTHSLYPEAIVLEMRYFHQSATNPYRTNASKRDKQKSLDHYKGKCQAKGCKKVLGNIVKRSIEFHHVKRGVPNQHEPKNLKPYCKGCHYKEHHP